MLRNYYSTEPVSDLLSDPETLVVLRYDVPCMAGVMGSIGTGLECLGDVGIHEVWAMRNVRVSRGAHGRCQWSKCDEFVIAAIWLSDKECDNVVSSVKSGYRELLDLTAKLGYPYAFRFWNFIADINSGVHDEERYKQFCTGRLNAFWEREVDMEGFPAASAVGHCQQGALIYLFAARQPATNYQNARQVNAYEYPRQYGVSSPSFARASSICLGGNASYFVSGTASIVGHESSFIGDLQGQLQTTLENLKYMLAQPTERETLELQTMKVYLRSENDYGDVEQVLKHAFPDTPTLYLRADICRSELLIEIECYCR